MTHNYENAKFFNHESYKALCAKVGECIKKRRPVR